MRKFILLVSLLVVAAMLILQRYNSMWGVRIAAAVMLLFFLANCVSALQIWNANSNFYGRNELERLIALLRPYTSFANVANDQVVAVVWSIAVLTLFQSVVFSIWWIAIPVCLFLLLPSAALRSLPPFALLLATSGDGATDLVNTVMLQIRPLAIRELLSLRPKSMHERLWNQLSSARIPHEFVNWKAAVECYCLVAKVIIIDARTVSSALSHELQIIGGHQLWYKVAILADSRLPVTRDLLGLTFEVGDTRIFDHASELAGFVGKLSERPNNLPTKEMPISRIVLE